MSVVWSMTSLESGRFRPGERCSELPDLAGDFSELRSSGQGYLEVRLPDSEYPQLTLSFRGDRAIIHLFTDEETVSLLGGDGTVPPEVTVDVPIMDELSSFTGDFVLSVDRAWDVVENFVRTGTFEELGEWFDL
ncbi:hypothetical protein ABZY09_01600 [Streptomyces sp. NPDC002928]|uniref:hypothetical protein n=1 Tax=Streptomyces sp. NPDC002928 TaxID=3154440 RepID=UPI0033BDC3D8